VVRDVYNYMKQSFKRSSEFKEFQVFVDCKPNKLLQPCQTRWLSLSSCIKRVLEQFDALKLYFQGFQGYLFLICYVVQLFFNLFKIHARISM